jgi:membrane protein YdbS with pleckstrin-like domain
MTTNFLATVLGWYLVISSLLLLLRREILIAAIKDLIGQNGVLLVVGVITLILGLLMVVTHNLWVMGWPVIITIFAWLILIGGIFRLFFPEMVYKIWEYIVNKSELLIASGVISLIIGLFLLYKVYF